MARGGVRAGAGRKPTLSDWDRIWIGAECERLRTRAIQQSLQERHDKKYRRHEIDSMLSDIKAVPAGLVRSRDGKSARRIVNEMADTGVPSDDSSIPESITEAAHALIDRRQVLDRVGRSTAAKRPYNYRELVVAEVAASATKKFGINISRRLVIEFGPITTPSSGRSVFDFCINLKKRADRL